MWELIDGQARPVDGLPPDDRGFLLGDGVFETFRLIDGTIRHGGLHGRSLTEACAALALEPPDWPAIEAAVSSLSESGGERVGKLIITRGQGGRGLSPIIDPAERVFFQDFDPPDKPDAVRLVSVDFQRSATSFAAQYKTLSYVDNLAARREAVARGGDMALLRTETGHVSGCDSANIFWLADGTVFTPSLRCGIRNGVMRRRVLRWLEAAGQAVKECQVPPDVLDAASAVWITNAVTGVTSVSKIDSRLLQTDDALLDKLRDADL